MAIYAPQRPHACCSINLNALHAQVHVLAHAAAVHLPQNCLPAHLISQADQEPMGSGRSGICGDLLRAGGGGISSILHHVRRGRWREEQQAGQARVRVHERACMSAHAPVILQWLCLHPTARPATWPCTLSTATHNSTAALQLWEQLVALSAGCRVGSAAGLLANRAHHRHCGLVSPSQPQHYRGPACVRAAAVAALYH